MEIIPELRGKGWAPRLLSRLQETVQAYPPSMRDDGWKVVGIADENDNVPKLQREVAHSLRQYAQRCQMRSISVVDELVVWLARPV